MHELRHLLVHNGEKMRIKLKRSATQNNNDYMAYYITDAMQVQNYNIKYVVNMSGGTCLTTL
jgi:hypothetical protein